MVVLPTSVVKVLPALLVPVEKSVSVEMAVREPPAPPIAPKMVDWPTSVVKVLPALLVPVEKRVSVEMGV